LSWREALQRQRKAGRNLQSFLERATSLAETVGLPVRNAQITVGQRRVGRIFDGVLQGDDSVLLFALREEQPAAIDGDDWILRGLLGKLGVKFRSLVSTIDNKLKLPIRFSTLRFLGMMEDAHWYSARAFVHVTALAVIVTDGHAGLG
jgi:hypothetical protein